MLDTYREVVTPEGVALHLPAAGPVPRALAWVIDLAIRGALMLSASAVLGLLGRGGMGLFAVLLFVVFWFYPVAVRSAVGRADAGQARAAACAWSPPTARRSAGWRAFTRNLLRVVDMLPFGYAAGLVASLVDPWGRRLGDMVAGTLVVHEARDARTARGAGQPGASRHRWRCSRTNRPRWSPSPSAPAPDPGAAGRTGRTGRAADRRARPAGGGRACTASPTGCWDGDERWHA